MTTKIMAMANQKGGVAKTTTTVNVAACAAEMGKKVLVVDLDPQSANATGWLTTSPPALSVANVLLEEGAIAEAVVPTVVAGVDLLGAEHAMYGIEKYTASQPGIEMVLAGALRQVSGYDLVLIDTPPTLGLLSVSGLVAARQVVIPVTMDSSSLVGVIDLLSNIKKITSRLNPDLEVAAVVPCKYHPRMVLDREVLLALVERFGDKVTPTVREAVRGREVSAHHQALTTYAPTDSITEDYRAVTAALLSKEEK